MGAAPAFKHSHFVQSAPCQHCQKVLKCEGKVNEVPEKRAQISFLQANERFGTE
jgi:hypothetical protein